MNCIIETILSLLSKDDEINYQSQMVEKLKEQMLSQEEVKTLGLHSSVSLVKRLTV